MEEKIAKLRKSVGSFCNHLETSCSAFRHSLDRRPIPLDSSTCTFVESVNKRAMSAGEDLNLLETMSLGTVSLEELLRHCYHLYHSNNSHLLHLRCSASLPQLESDSDEEASDELPDTSRIEVVAGGAWSLDEDPFMEDPFSFKSMGLSDAGLALMSATRTTNQKLGGDDPTIRKLEESYEEDRLFPTKGVLNFTEETQSQYEDDPRVAAAPETVLKVSRGHYDSLPSSLKSLASWEDLLVVVEKINSILSEQSSTGSNYLNHDDIASLGLGPKARTYLLLLKRMNALVIETIDGSIWYKIV